MVKADLEGRNRQRLCGNKIKPSCGKIRRNTGHRYRLLPLRIGISHTDGQGYGKPEILMPVYQILYALYPAQGLVITFLLRIRTDIQQVAGTGYQPVYGIIKKHGLPADAFLSGVPVRKRECDFLIAGKFHVSLTEKGIVLGMKKVAFSAVFNWQHFRYLRKYKFLQSCYSIGCLPANIKSRSKKSSACAVENRPV